MMRGPSNLMTRDGGGSGMGGGGGMGGGMSMGMNSMMGAGGRMRSHGAGRGVASNALQELLSGHAMRQVPNVPHGYEGGNMRNGMEMGGSAVGGGSSSNNTEQLRGGQNIRGGNGENMSGGGSLNSGSGSSSSGRRGGREDGAGVASEGSVKEESDQQLSFHPSKKRRFSLTHMGPQVDFDHIEVRNHPEPDQKLATRSRFAKFFCPSNCNNTRALVFSVD